MSSAKILADERKARLEPRHQALFDFVAKLSTTPLEATSDDAQALKKAGLSFFAYTARPAVGVCVE